MCGLDHSLALSPSQMKYSDKTGMGRMHWPVLMGCHDNELTPTLSKRQHMTNMYVHRLHITYNIHVRTGTYTILSVQIKALKNNRHVQL